MARYRKFDLAKEISEVQNAKAGAERIAKAQEWAENYVITVCREKGLFRHAISTSLAMYNAVERLEKAGVIVYTPGTAKGFYCDHGYALVV
jgi:hypothetical protein